ncbi:MAG TPA: hypothetical protein VH092_03400 [Urbifossiella sp.]|jgi:antitoxin (DNA-binding transcriptional repressor) of toxin-antitoxin stability system|nr:hypothetical protein [Urbifossiella sp.]
MTTLNTADPGTTLTALLAAVRRGESVLLLDAGRPVARVEPAEPPAAEDDSDDDERPWRGMFTDLNRGVPPPGWKLPPETDPPPRLPPMGNLNWLPDREDEDE